MPSVQILYEEEFSDIGDEPRWRLPPRKCYDHAKKSGLRRFHRRWDRTPAKTGTQERCRFADESIGTLSSTPAPTLLSARIPNRLLCFCPTGEELRPRRVPP